MVVKLKSVSPLYYKNSIIKVLFDYIKYLIVYQKHNYYYSYPTTFNMGNKQSISKARQKNIKQIIKQNYNKQRESLNICT
jgi:hypothetical protein